MIERLRREFQAQLASNYLQHGGISHGLRSEGKPYWNKFLRKMINGEPAVASEAIDAVRGFKYHLSGFDSLPELDPEKGVLVIANHSSEGPLRGWGQFIVMQNAFRQATGKEIVWTQGNAASGSSNTVRESVRTIHVGSGNGVEGARNVLQALKTEAVGIFAEGTQKRDLRKGNYRTGKIMARAVRHTIPIICIATSYVNGNIYVAADILVASEIQRLEAQRENAEPYQAIVDYAMTTIASHLPENRRGFYQPAPIELVREKI